MLKLLPTTYFLVPAFAYILLLFGCGAEETVNTPLAENGATDITPAPKSSLYFPITLGSRWTYRNPDGSEWSREVAESEVFDAERYHSFSYEPPIELDSIESAEYLTYFDRLVRRTNLKDIDDAVWETIVESGGGTNNWGLGMSCFQRPGRKPWCVPKKNIFKPGILAYLYCANTSVVWHSKLTLLRYPLFPSQTYSALDLRLAGRTDNCSSYIYDYNTKGTILGRASDNWESVETPAGSFEDSIRIQYEAKLTSFTMVEFQDLFPGDGNPFIDAAREAIESELLNELTDLLPHIMAKLGLQTMWLAPGVGPVKIETPNGIAELIDYDIKTGQ